MCANQFIVSMVKKDSYSTVQLTAMVLLRVFIGWHFAYEGLVKILNPKWSALPYLLDSKGIMSDFFAALAGDTAMLDMVNLLNEWTLLLIGLGLITGTFSKLSSIGAIILLGFYYLSHPSFIGASYMMPFEGSYLWIDKNLVELVAVCVLLAFPTSHIIGVDRFLKPAIPLLSKLKLM